ncbi:MAG: ribosome small subunit-dependent GTPase A [Bdellovibrio sp.]|nr:ribosome small subunit-dependent GTPase A [Bdellovibrio sp.]
MDSLNLMNGQNCVYKSRILHEEKNCYRVKIESDEVRAVISGKMRHEALVPSELPAVGDYVMCSYEPHNCSARIEKVLPRISHLTRKVAGDAYSEQILASNLQVVFYLTSLNMDLNLRRLERYLVMIRDGNITPVVLLSKADLVDKKIIGAAIEKVKSVAPTVDVHAISARQTETLEGLKKYLLPDSTVACLGSSGVGKSTLTNSFLGHDLQATQEISEERDKGRHTTTSRSLFYLANGCAFIDTPGIREIQLWEGQSAGIDELFSDIIALRLQCQYSNCHHQHEPGCRIQLALSQGCLDEARLKSFLKLEREQAYMRMKVNATSRRQQKDIWKKRSHAYRRGRKAEWNL